MPVQTWEQRPPTVQAVQFTGDNAAELAEFAGLEDVPAIVTDEDGARFVDLELASWTGPVQVQLAVTDHLLRQYGTVVVSSDAALRSQYRPAAIGTGQ